MKIEGVNLNNNFQGIKELFFSFVHKLIIDHSASNEWIHSYVEVHSMNDLFNVKLRSFYYYN